MLQITPCYLSPLYKTKTQSTLASANLPLRMFTAVIMFITNHLSRLLILIHAKAALCSYGTSLLLSGCAARTSQMPACSPFFYRSHSCHPSLASRQPTVFFASSAMASVSWIRPQAPGSVLSSSAQMSAEST